MDLSSFFRENAVKTEEVKYVVSTRFVDKNKKPVEWILKPVSSQTDEDLRRQSTIRTKNATGQYQTDLDVNKYIGLLAVACTVYPNLNDANLQNSYNVMGADSLLKKMLLPGEYANYLLKVLPSQFINMSKPERAFIIASIDLKIEYEKKELRKVKRKRH